MTASSHDVLDGVDAVVFDKDGTLIDVHATWGPAMVTILTELVSDAASQRRAAAAIGVDLDLAQLADDSPVIAETNAEIAARLSVALGRNSAELTTQLEQLVTRHVVESVTPLPGVQKMLESLSEAGLWLGVATNDGERSARKQVDRLGWSDLFDNVFGYDSGHGGKPGPGMVKASAEEAGCGVGRTVMVGDTLTDIAAATAAGCRSILIDPTGRLGSAATLVVDSPSQIAGLIGR